MRWRCARNPSVKSRTRALSSSIENPSSVSAPACEMMRDHTRARRRGATMGATDATAQSRIAQAVQARTRGGPLSNESSCVQRATTPATWAATTRVALSSRLVTLACKRRTILQPTSTPRRTSTFGEEPAPGDSGSSELPFSRLTVTAGGLSEASPKGFGSERRAPKRRAWRGGSRATPSSCWARLRSGSCASSSLARRPVRATRHWPG
jgi:hypothetical protein